MAGSHFERRVLAAADNTQSYNRYSYLWNNPLNATDPSGFFLDKLWDEIKPFAGALFYGVGQEFTGAAEGGLGHITAHGMVGGMMSVAQGGRFEHGFAAAGFTKAMNINGISEGDTSAPAVAARVTTAALVGGTASKISGGKFANGAVTAALAQAVNGESAQREKARRSEQQSKYNSAARRYSARQARADLGSTRMPNLKPGIYPAVVDSFSVTGSPLSVEVGDIWVIDSGNQRVLHYAYAGAGPAVGIAAIGSREFGAAYLNDGSELAGFSLSGESDGVIGFGGSGSLNVPTVPLNPGSTTFSGGPSVGFGAGLSGIGSYSWFQKSYGFDEAPSHLPLGR